MICPKCGKNEAFWFYGMGKSLYKCDACGHEFHVDLDKWDADERKSGYKEHKDGRDYITKD